MDITHNPYLNRSMIRDIKDFYGRKREVARIYSRLGAAHPQSVSIVGPRRIGKSSLLNFIYQEANRRKYLKHHRQYKFVFIDFQERKRITLPEFFIELFELLSREFSGQLEITESPNYEGLKDVVTKIQQQGLKLILLFDEFDSITQNKNFDTEFFAFLRALANRYDIAYVVSSGRRLQDFCHTKEIADSPFFNIFSNLFLSPFSREEALTLIGEPSKDAGYPLDSVADEIISMAGYFPFFIQVSCSTFFEYAMDYSAELQDVALAEIHELFLEEAKDHFQYIWDIFDESERRVCLRIVRREEIAPPDMVVLRGLSQQGYVIVKSDGPVLFSSLFTQQVEMMETRREAEHAKESHESHIKQDYIPEAMVIVDIVGSTGLSHRYGAHLLRSLYSQLEAIGFEVAERFHARYRRSRGDGLLLTFNTVADAVNCSLEIQKRIRGYNNTVEARNQIPVRFVINFGETIADEKGERYGDAVNMTFKVEAFVSEALVGPDKGGLPSYDYIVVTEHVYREMASKEGVQCRELGAFELPGLTGLHRLYELKHA
jgi:class 3 adenylate cyclase/AAA+ ATPase superfamily predicted ATPase